MTPARPQPVEGKVGFRGAGPPQPSSGRTRRPETTAERRAERRAVLAPRLRWHGRARPRRAARAGRGRGWALAGGGGAAAILVSPPGLGGGTERQPVGCGAQQPDGEEEEEEERGGGGAGPGDGLPALTLFPSLQRRRLLRHRGDGFWSPPGRRRRRSGAVPRVQASDAGRRWRRQERCVRLLRAWPIRRRRGIPGGRPVRGGPGDPLSCRGRSRRFPLTARSGLGDSAGSAGNRSA